MLKARAERGKTLRNPAGPKPPDQPGEEPGQQDSLDLHTGRHSPQLDVPLDASGVTPEDTHAARQASAPVMLEDELDAALLDLMSGGQKRGNAHQTCQQKGGGQPEPKASREHVV